MVRLADALIASAKDRGIALTGEAGLPTELVAVVRVREIVGIPVVLIKHFSRRRTAIEDRYYDLAAECGGSRPRISPRGAARARPTSDT